MRIDRPRLPRPLLPLKPLLAKPQRSPRPTVRRILRRLPSPRQILPHRRAKPFHHLRRPLAEPHARLQRLHRVGRHHRRVQAHVHLAATALDRAIRPRRQVRVDVRHRAPSRRLPRLRRICPQALLGAHHHGPSRRVDHRPRRPPILIVGHIRHAHRLPIDLQGIARGQCVHVHRYPLLATPQRRLPALKRHLRLLSLAQLLRLLPLLLLPIRPRLDRVPHPLRQRLRARLRDQPRVERLLRPLVHVGRPFLHDPLAVVAREIPRRPPLVFRGALAFRATAWRTDRVGIQKIQQVLPTVHRARDRGQLAASGIRPRKLGPHIAHIAQSLPPLRHRRPRRPRRPRRRSGFGCGLGRHLRRHKRGIGIPHQPRRHQLRTHLRRGLAHLVRRHRPRIVFPGLTVHFHGGPGRGWRPWQIAFYGLPCLTLRRLPCHQAQPSKHRAPSRAAYCLQSTPVPVGRISRR